jgi:hypothetical protein
MIIKTYKLIPKYIVNTYSKCKCKYKIVFLNYKYHKLKKI